MLNPSVPSQRAGRDGAAHLQLVRRYARLLRETTAQTAAVRRSTALRAPRPHGRRTGDGGPS